MRWDVRAKDEDSWLISHVRSIISSGVPSLPPKQQRFGNSTVEWEERKPGEAVIWAHGGTVDDRTFAEQLCKTQLAGHGYRRAQFYLDGEDMRRTAAWPDIMAKAKRLIQSGQVTMLRNGYNNIVAHVIGDHGEYNVEIGRDDPDSQAITTWQCECPWDQYAWGRTRQWKKYEGRPCAHVLAAYWKSKSTPLDDYNPEQHGPMPGQKMGPAPGMPGHPVSPLQGQIPETPESPQSPGAPSVPGAPKLPQAPAPPGMGAQPDAIGNPNPLQQPLAPPMAPGILPPSPMEQLQQMQPPMPGATPGGGVAPPGSVSVPGAKLPSPFNPVQYPGGTYSHEGDPEDIRRVIDRYHAIGPEVDPQHTGWDCHTGANMLTHLCNQAGIAAETVPGRYWHPTAESRNKTMGYEGDDADGHRDELHYWSMAYHPKVGNILLDPNGEDRGEPRVQPAVYGSGSAAEHYQGQNGSYEPFWYEEQNDQYWDPMWKEAHPLSDLIPEEAAKWDKKLALGMQRTAAQEFYPQQPVILRNNVWGQAEGKSEEHGAGQYVEVQARKANGSPQHAEVLYQDPTTGFIEIAVSNDEGGPLEPFLTRCFVEPGDITPARNNDPGFIRRK